MPRPPEEEPSDDDKPKAFVRGGVMGGGVSKINFIVAGWTYEEVLTNAMAEAYKSMPDEIEKYGMPEPKWRVDYGSGDRPDEL